MLDGIPGKGLAVFDGTIKGLLVTGTVLYSSSLPTMLVHDVQSKVDAKLKTMKNPFFNIKTPKKFAISDSSINDEKKFRRKMLHDYL